MEDGANPGRMCPNCGTGIPVGAVECPHCEATFAGTSAKAEFMAPLPALPGYHFIRLLGRGGMGAVYLAEEQALGRRVAIKVVSEFFARQPEYRARFVREARTMATVEHPNVARVYSFGETEGRLYLVMEFVEGEMLAERIKRTGGLKPQEALDLLKQVVEALQAAWEKGIVHRDVKPTNILLDRKNRVRVADFGLAKPAQLEQDSEISSTGAMIGTPYYLPPEQARGMPAGFRGDVYSLGIVLYEMLAGHRPFEGTTPFAVVDKHLNAPLPLLKDKRPDVPDSVQQLIEWMTQKNPEDRPSYPVLLQTIDSFLGISSTKTFVPVFTDSGRLAGGTKRAAWKIPAAVAAALLLLAASIYGVIRFARPQPKAPQQLTRLTTGPGLEDEPSWSPDGKFIAYTSDERGNLDLRILPLSGGQPLHLADSDADDAQPAWSPDGSRIAFVSARDQTGVLSIVLGQDIGQFLNAQGGDLFVVPAFGGTPARLAANAYYPAWSPDSKEIAFQSDADGQWDLWAIPAGGGKARRITQDPEFDYQPGYSPDNQWIVYGHGRIPDFHLRVVPVAGGTPVDLTMEKNSYILRPAFSPDSKFIVYSLYNGQTTNIWKIPFNADAPAEHGPPERVTTGESDHIDLSLLGNRMAYTSAGTTADIFELQRATGAIRQVSFETSSEEFPHLSPDGKTLVVHSDRGGRQALWTMDLNGNILSQVTSGNEIANSPRFSPDGTRIAYQIGSDIRASRVVIQRIGEAAVQEIVKDGENPSWSPDGKYLAMARIVNQKGEIWIYSLETLKGRRLTGSRNDESWPTWSPDGRWIAYQSGEPDGRRHIWKIPVEGGTSEELTDEPTEDSHPQWNPASNDEILFLRNHKNLFLLSVSTRKTQQITFYKQSNIILDFPSWSFDGKTVYFNAQRKVGDIYVLENY